MYLLMYLVALKSLRGILAQNSFTNNSTLNGFKGAALAVFPGNSRSARRACVIPLPYDPLSKATTAECMTYCDQFTTVSNV